MPVDKKAPLIAKKETIINASINHVWKLQSDITNWQKWQPDVSQAQLNGALKQGSTFRWKAMGIAIFSTLQVVEENHIIGWTGDSVGMHAVHYWYFEKLGNTTKVITEESLSGWFPLLIKFFKPNFLETSLSKALRTLKEYAEKTPPIDRFSKAFSRL